MDSQTTIDQEDQIEPTAQLPGTGDTVQQVKTEGGVGIVGDVNTGSGDFTGRDKITVHDIQDAKGVAIGAGAQAIVNEIINNITQQALSAVDEADKARANVLRALAENVRDYAQRLTQLAHQQHDAQQGGPYRGLIAYTLADAELFFGRRRATAELLEHMGANRLTVLQSESGAGKSSLLQAGIAPQLLLNGHLPVILRSYDLSPSLKIKQTFLTGLETHAEFQAASLRYFLQAVTRVLGQATTLYLVLDQFEEFFTLLRPDVHLTTEQMRTNFVDELADCLEDPSLNVRWVLAVRSEFFGDLAHFRPRIRNPFDNDYRLNRLTPAEAEAVITEPAAQYQIDFEPALVDAILADLKQPDGQIAPPQIQLVCQALYQALKDAKDEDPNLSNTIITLAMYKQERKAKGILGRYLNRVLSRTLHTKEEQDLARRLLIELVSSNQRRLRLSHSELAKRLATALIATQSLDDVLENLIDTHLLIAKQDDDDPEATYELAHDYLLDEIQVDPTVQAQKAAQELLQQEAEAYQRFHTLLSKEKFAIINGQRSLLVVDEKAQELLKLSENKIHQEEYAKEVARQRELKQARDLANRQRWLLIAVTTILMLVVGAGWYIYGQNKQLAIEKQHAETAKATAETAQATAEVSANLANQNLDIIGKAFEVPVRYKELYSEILKQSGAQIFRIYPRGELQSMWIEEAGIRGGGSYYSFLQHSHEYGQGNELGYESGSFRTGFAGADYGYFLSVGNIEITKVVTSRLTPPSWLTSSKAEAWNYLWTYQPPSDIREIRQQQAKAHGFPVGASTLSETVAAVENTSYLLRAIMIDDADVLIAFYTHKRLDDGSFVIVGRIIKTFDTPVATGSEN